MVVELQLPTLRGCQNIILHDSHTNNNHSSHLNLRYMRYIGVALQFVVPPTMLALLFEEAVTVAGLHEGSSSLISGGLGLVGGSDRDGECHQLASCVQSCWLRTPGGAIPARTYRLSTLVGRRHPVMHLQLSLREASNFFAWDDLSHTGQAYSATE